MSSVDNRQQSATTEQDITTGSLQLPGLVDELSPVEQLSFPEYSPLSLRTSPLPGYQSSPGATRQLPFNVSPNVTGQLPDVQTGALNPLKDTTTSFRQQVVIRSTGKKSTGTMRPPKGRRSGIVNLAVTAVILLIALGTLMAVVPAGSHGEAGFNPFRPIMDMAKGGNSSPSFLAQQAATVTAVTRDGYEPGNHQTYAGLPTPPPDQQTIPPSSGGYNSFTYGQCTYWADLRYHELTGHWVPWSGNAAAWAYGASASGWVVSSSPHVPSIIVLQPGVQGAGSYTGHVAVVERINSDGSVWTSNWNWYGNGGGWATWSAVTFYPGPGVSFVWYPGA